MTKSRLYLESGLCTRCGEWTQLGEPCCNALVSYEGLTWTRDEVIERDADAGLSCACSECRDSDSGPCSAEGCEPPCIGCLRAYPERYRKDSL